MQLQTNGNIRIERYANLSESDLIIIAQQVNEIYLDEEKGIWPTDGKYERTNPETLKQTAKSGELIVAFDGNQPVATIKVYKIDSKWYFGMLTTFYSHRKRGIAKQLINYVEAFLKKDKIDNLYIELLFSPTLEMPHKHSLKMWYENLGYKYIETIKFTDVNPEKASIMAHDCVFEILCKNLK
jgi:GNAT superfamily N-acetyltransferase